MKNLYLKFGNAIAALALIFATISVNSTCRHYMYQGKLPESVDELRKIK